MQSVLGFIAVIVGLVLAFKLIIVVAHVVGWLLPIVGSIIWIGALIHIALTQFSNFATKAISFVVVLFTHVFGAIAYLLFGRPRNALTSSF